MAQKVYRSATLQRVASAEQYDGTPQSVVSIGDWVKSNGVEWLPLEGGVFAFRDSAGTMRALIPGDWVVKQDQRQVFDRVSQGEFEAVWEEVPIARPATLLDERRRLIRD